MYAGIVPEEIQRCLKPMRIVRTSKSINQQNKDMEARKGSYIDGIHSNLILRNQVPQNSASPRARYLHNGCIVHCTVHSLWFSNYERFNYIITILKFRDVNNIVLSSVFSLCGQIQLILVKKIVTLHFRKTLSSHRHKSSHFTRSSSRQKIVTSYMNVNCS